ncbi:MAG TPA: hypothetical protein VN873_12585 [Candidatus Angelobacter sp.]|nr:hypothetical protein [Candidatus Angelobacter sp.]
MSMTRKEMRELVHQSPFQPFRLHLSGGKDLRVPHPDFALVTAEYVVIANVLRGGSSGSINLVPYEHIARIEMLPAKSRKAV